MRIAIFELEDWERSVFESLEPDHDLQLLSEPLTIENVDQYADVEAISTFIYSKLTPEVIEHLPQLKLVVTRSTGFDHVPVKACEDRQVTVCNIPSYGDNTVAEHVFALLLTISRRMEQAIDRCRKGDFSSRGLQGFDLRGRTLGVIGTGNIGQETLRIAKGFGMHTIAYDVKPNHEAAESLGFDYVSLPELLKRSDVVSLHVPATDSSQHLLSSEEFEQMKPSAVLINTARGSVVDTKAMVQALAEEKIAAVGLDVLPQEPVIREEAELLRSVYEKEHDLETLLADQVLTNMRNVVVTPHSAFRTEEAVQRILESTVENLRAFASGEPQNVVTA